MSETEDRVLNNEPQSSSSEEASAEEDCTRADTSSEDESSEEVGTAQKERAQEKSGVSRRSFIAGACGAVAVLGVGGAGVLATKDESILRPPGGQDETHFIGSCIRCDRCRSSCPRDTIEVSGIEAGLINMRTARLDYRGGRITSGFERLRSFSDPFEGLLAIEGTGFCDFCELCIANCPTGALSAFDPKTQWIGEAVIVPEICIAFEKRGGCRKCVDYCAFGAIELDEDLRPVVVAERCNGCGVCENICPTNTYRTFTGPSQRGINVNPMPEGRPQ